MNSLNYGVFMSDALALAAIALGAAGCLLGFLLYLRPPLWARGLIKLSESLSPELLSDPAFWGGVVRHALTDGVKCADGTQATVPDVLQGFVDANSPRFQAWMEQMIPQLIALAFRKDLAVEMANKSHLADGVSKLGGGLKGVQALQHGLKRSGAGGLGMLGQLAETAPALIQLVQLAKESGLVGAPSKGGSTFTTGARPPSGGGFGGF